MSIQIALCIGPKLCLLAHTVLAGSHCAIRATGGHAKGSMDMAVNKQTQDSRELKRCQGKHKIVVGFRNHDIVRAFLSDLSL